VPLSTLIVVESPFRHTVHYISTDHVSPSSTSDWSSTLSTSSSDSHSGSGVDASTFQSADADVKDERCRLIDVTSPLDSGADDDEGTVADLSDLDELREADLLPLCSSSSESPPPFYLGLTDDELRHILVDEDPDSGGTPVAAVGVDDFVSAAELSWPSPSAAAIDTGLQAAAAAAAHDYCTPEVIELLGSVYDDWLRHDPDTASFFSPA